ncbi:hypothetical protein U8527_01150 [Kordia algicida OT-1]|uniref:Uncharacterized protein n=1 Tax=Kordia algicida OT-1 TaxID=391587 RepID=A9DS92_9FLAO|nr:hypothetical protein [Kordia algicida]EDP96902.1 hypothetical protein KAOT1_17103 [Kordia algicida OT-1]
MIFQTLQHNIAALAQKFDTISSDRKAQLETLSAYIEKNTALKKLQN